MLEIQPGAQLAAESGAVTRKRNMDRTLRNVMLLCLNIACVVYSKKILSVCKTGENRENYILRDGITESHVAWGSFNDEISSTG